MRIPVGIGLSVALLGLLVSQPAGAAEPAGALPSPSTFRSPDAYGLTAYNIEAISALSFLPEDSTLSYASGPDFFRYLTSGGGGVFLAGVTIPAGAVIDSVGLTTCDEPGQKWAATVLERVDDGSILNSNIVVQLLSTEHGPAAPCTTDYNPVALDYLVTSNVRRTIQVFVTQVDTAATDGSERFGSVEIWWHRTVSPAPGAATFNDVPTGHPFFQYVEALAASGITGGCGNGNYCPDAPLTRGQMAVFLSKALGLHFPGNPTQ
jgi:hypothetical protein